MNKCCRNNLANNIPDRNKQCLYNVEIAFEFYNKFETFASCKKLLLKTIHSKLYYSTNGSLVFDLILLIIKLIQFYFRIFRSWSVYNTKTPCSIVRLWPISTRFVNPISFFPSELVSANDSTLHNCTPSLKRKSFNWKAYLNLD
jgi:hypothetical protein